MATSGIFEELRITRKQPNKLTIKVMVDKGDTDGSWTSLDSGGRV